MKEKTADKMFKELGYKKVEGLNDNYAIWYVNKNYIGINRIFFNILDRKLHFELNYDLSMQELQAINKKCEELGWIERN